MNRTSILSIKKPCQNFDTSCQKTDRLGTFGKLPSDVRALPKKALSPTGKLVFSEYAERSRGTDRAVAASERDIAAGSGISRASVIPALRQLLKIGLFVKDGLPVKQIQAYRIIHPMFKASEHQAKEPEKRLGPHDWVTCPACYREKPSLLKVGWCRACAADKKVEHISRRVAREEIEKSA